MVSDVQVIKRSGEREEFDPLKIVSSMIRSGAPKEEAESILRTLEPKLYDGISTEESIAIYIG